VTHRPEDEPEGVAFTFVSGVEEAIERAKAAAGDKDVHVMGGRTSSARLSRRASSTS
jgi:dihydrofolate reductase